jgi:DNA-binding NtrC family response regulator
MDRPWKILIVEDDESIQMSLEAHFEDMGFSVKAAGSAEDAIAMLADEGPDAAIVDLRLPGMGGEALIRQIHARFPHTVCIIYTGSVEFDISPDLKQLAVVSSTVFFKPVDDLNVISDEVTRLLNSVKFNSGS